MKIKNVFKKSTKNVAKVQSLDKKQLEKVMGGAETEKGITINTTHVEWSK